MTKPTIRELVLPWYEHMTALDTAWRSWRELGVNIEAPFPDAAWRISDAYTKSVSDRLYELYGVGPCGRSGTWLSWFMYEIPKAGGFVRVDEKEFHIITPDDFIDFLNDIAKPGPGHVPTGVSQ